MGGRRVCSTASPRATRRMPAEAPACAPRPEADYAPWLSLQAGQTSGTHALADQPLSPSI
ncbi:hypothetical protein E2562_018115 [Oryza meyeriana var. granulata]|uniref:Uncharacterized protein n=1 Tax=Oryza meyeriana var. granulata TaxID=110450 RepID=A0A6G1C5N4_9ORYZ|nr:hypothetical protein E2562_018115 [Oryza meyeriana var. granulata]